MKKVIISLIAAIFIMIIIPLIVVELLPPRNNANSTEPIPSPVVTDTAV